LSEPAPGSRRANSSNEQTSRKETAKSPNTLIQSGGRGESHPPAPTEPCVTVSRHTALTTLSGGSPGSRPIGRTHVGSGR
jgi:hypothetical protein